MAKAFRKGPKSTFDKVKEVDPEFVNTVYTLTEEQLKEKIVALTRNEQEMDQAKSGDMDLARIREELKTANETYSGPLKASKLKKKLILEVLGTRGK